MKQLRHFHSDLLGGKPGPSEIYRARADTIIREEFLAIRLKMSKQKAKQVSRNINEAQLMLPFIL